MTIEELVQKALELEKQGEKEEALATVSTAFDMLVIEAGNYATKKLGITDIEILRTKTTELFDHSNTHLRQNLTASMLLNTMGVLFMELGEYDASKQKFEESNSLIPDAVEYNDPVENLQILIEKVASLTPQEDENQLED